MPALDAWIGRKEHAEDLFSENLLRRIAAIFNAPLPTAGEPLPALWHWCFFQQPVEASLLGADGHPARGGFLPPADERNRMWAGGRLQFIRPLRAGASAQRRSTLLSIEEKTGKSGELMFVTVGHEYLQDAEVCLREEQDIVYRQPSAPKLQSAQVLPEGHWAELITPTPTLLFRYSAATFNGHRIHYDFPYATEVEGYPGLVVHGPLIATLSVAAFQRANPTAQLRSLSFRGLRPLMVPDMFEVGGQISGPGTAQLWAGNQAGIAQQAEVGYGQAGHPEDRRA